MGRGRETGIRQQIAGWFLMVGLLPLITIALVNYFSSRNNLAAAASEDLNHVALEKVRFINNWFDYRWMDISSLASQLALSDPWQLKSRSIQKQLQITIAQYDYVRNIFLVDPLGRLILAGDDTQPTGTDPSANPLTTSDFSRTLERTLNSGQIELSEPESNATLDLSHIKYLMAPVKRTSGETIGVVAIEIGTQRIEQLLSEKYRSHIHHYIIANRSALPSALTQYLEQPNSVATTYSNAKGIQVFGVASPLSIGDNNWYLISEAEQGAAFAVSNWLMRLDTGVLLASILFIGWSALWVSRRIARPITELSKRSAALANGEFLPALDITNNSHELNELVDNFNTMLLAREGFEKRLLNSKAEMKSVLNELRNQQFALHHHAIVAVTDVRGTITYVNSKFEELSGYSSKELIGNNHRLLNSGYHPRSFFRDMYREISKGEVWHAEICNRAKQGHLYWVATTIAPLRDEHDKISRYIAIRTDITQQKEVQQQLRNANTQAETAIRTKSEFLANMGHEFRTPMNAIIGMLGLLQRTQLNPDQQRQTQIAMQSADSLLQIMNDILEYSNMESEGLDIEAIDFDLCTMLGELVQSLAPRAKAKNLELVLNVVGIEHSMVKGDPGRLRQLITLLLDNAIKFTNQGEIVVSANLRTTTEYVYRFECCVSDTGIGISPDQIDRIFDTFTQADGSATRRYGGIGMGLSIAKQLCLLMDGDLTVTSEQAKGSQFSFHIALAPSNHSIPLLPPLDLRGVTILVVESNRTNREVLQQQLAQWDANVELADTGNHALSMLENSLADSNKKLPAAILIDMELPDINGEVLGQTIRQHADYDDVKLIMMTAYAKRGDAKRMVESGFNGYFPKPLTLTDLLNALKVLLGEESKPGSKSPFVTSHYLKELQLPSPNTDLEQLENHQSVVLQDKEISISHILWDHQDALQRVRNKPERLHTLIDMFLESSPELITTIRRDISDQSFDQAAISIHTLKGIAGNLSLVQLMSAVVDLETSLRQGEKDELDAKIDALHLHYRKTFELLEQHQQSTQPVSRSG